MRIESSSLHLQSAHELVRTREVTETLRTARPGRSGRGRGRGRLGRTRVDNQDSANFTDAKTRLKALLIERLTGQKVRFYRPQSGGGSAVPQRGGGGGQSAVSYQRREVVRESESTRFVAEGSVKTASGEEISFSLSLALDRQETSIREVSFQTGQLEDPLVVNFDGAGARLSSDRTEFDLDGDGVNELIATLAPGSAWLAHDADGSGAIENGTELFGPSTGNGFAELAKLDSDGNGWIDEGDEAFDQLGVYDSNGAFTSLRDAGLGALSVNAVATPFSLKEGGELLGQVQASSVFLTEDGNAGFLQQVDLVV